MKDQYSFMEVYYSLVYMNKRARFFHYSAFKVANMMAQQIKWGIIGPGSIAKDFYDDLVYIKNEHHIVNAIVGHSKETTEKFLAERPVQFVYYDIENLISEGEVDCVYVASPHPLHYDACIRLLTAGIPVLCEKPLAISARQVSELINASQKYNTFLMEGMWIRFLPSINTVLAYISQGLIGDVSSIEARLTYKAPYDEQSRYFKKELGGGSLLDLGIYPIYLSYLISGMPVAIKAVSINAETGVDGGTAAVMSHEGGSYSLVESSLIKRAPNEATIFGSKGFINIAEPFNEMPEKITLQIYDGDKTEVIPNWEGKGLYFEVIEMMKCIKSSKIESDLLSHKGSLELVSIMDEIRKQIRLTYPNE